MYVASSSVTFEAPFAPFLPGCPHRNTTGSTRSLRRGKVEIAKKTEYKKVGHGISRFPFDDPQLIEWLFQQQFD